MAGWHHRLDEHGFGWTPGVGDGQGGLACCGSWGHKELDRTEQLPFIYSSVYLLNTYSQLSPFPIPFGNHKSESVSYSVVSNSMQPHEL